MPSPLRKPCGWTWWRKGWLRKCIQWNGLYGTYAWSFTTIKLFTRWSRKDMSCFLLTSFLLSPNFWDDKILQELSSEDKDYRAECQKEPHAGQGRILVNGAGKKSTSVPRLAGFSHWDSRFPPASLFKLRRRKIYVSIILHAPGI